MNRSASTDESVPVVIVGAGPAGLAVGACLKRLSIPFVLLEQAAAIGSSWRGHYDRLHLHTDKSHSSLPFLPFPKEYPRYPSRQQVVDYLERYARFLNLTPRLHQKVLSARREDGAWVVDTKQTRFRAQALVVTAGVNSEPNVPVWPGQESYQGLIVHSASYKNGAQFAGRRVLVVGLGNSGGEMAIDLFEHGALPTVAVRNPVNVIPREAFGVPFLTMGILQQRLPPRIADAINAPLTRWLVGNLEPFGLRKPELGPIAQIHEQGKVPFIDVGTIKLIRDGHVQVRPGIERFTEDGVVFTDGRQEAFDAVVLATGFKARVDRWLHTADAVLDEDGCPMSSGRPIGLTGLYFCGYHISPTGMLREIGLEAQRIAPLVQRHISPATGPSSRTLASAKAKNFV